MGGRVARGHAHDDDRDERQDERDVVGDDERHAGPRDVLEAMIAAIAPEGRERRRELHGHDPRVESERRGHAPAARRSLVRT